MASIFKRGKDKNNRHAKYVIEFTDHTGKTRRRTGFTDKSQTAQLAAKLAREARERKEGLIDADRENAVEQRHRPIAEHLADFEATLKRKQVTEEHVKRTISRTQRIITDCGIDTIADIDVDDIGSVLQEMLEADEIGHRTYNHYVQAIDSFCRWLVPKRFPVNPLSGMTRLNAEVDIRHQRRALSDKQVASLIRSARESGVKVQAYDGEQRARVYFTSYLTGLRRRELGLLTPRCFDLGRDQPTLTVEAACSKHRKQDTLPLHPELIAVLPDWLAGMGPDDPLFPDLGRKKTWLMVKKDLERIGVPYRNEDGVADFHAAGRHSYVTGLLRNGATLTEARELARHSDVRMTMKYTHIGLNDQAKALASLPVPSSSAGDVSESVSDFVSEPGFPACHELSPDVTETTFPECENPSGDRGYDAELLALSATGTDGQKWRIGDSNP